MALNHLDLFSGIAGFRLAADLAGITFDNSYHSDIEDFSNRVYARRYPDSIQLGDIRTIDGNKLRARHPGDWIVTGGFPCTDISQAGSRRGLSGERSGLWFEMLRVIRELRPAYVVAENVAALCGNGLDRVLAGLSEAGFDSEWDCISAGSIGAPHRRERIWIVAYPELHGCGVRPDSQHPQNAALGEVLATDDQNEGLPPWADWMDVAAKGTILSEPIVRRVADGLSEGMDETLSRIKALGNSIVPQVAKGIFERIKGC